MKKLVKFFLEFTPEERRKIQTSETSMPKKNKGIGKKRKVDMDAPISDDTTESPSGSQDKEDGSGASLLQEKHIGLSATKTDTTNLLGSGDSPGSAEEPGGSESEEDSATLTNLSPHST